uniref:hydroxymethylglutaryl-CoA reductase (NADPH) n=1 Tax=Arcella intermedia TaxID=1963864 RepID=A0A6B2KY20_9EUKA
MKTRVDQVEMIFPTLKVNTSLPGNLADVMIENCIGTLSIPLGLGLNFLINGKELVVPMSTEEPSVVAAVSGAAKTISEHGGFSSTYTGNIMVCQIQQLEVPNAEAAEAALQEQKDYLIQYGNRFCPSMVSRGGGIKNLEVRRVYYNRENYFKVHEPGDDSRSADGSVGDRSVQNEHVMLIIGIYIDVCESMGANTVNTVAENLSPEITKFAGGRSNLKVVSNFCTERRATAKFVISVESLRYKTFSGAYMAQRMMEAYIMACEDPHRAVTHNKGVMNGVDAVAIATGQDFRAIEAAAHAWASRTGRYSPLTKYRFIKVKDSISLEGSIDLPVPIGVRGGSIQSQPSMEFTHGILSNPTTAELAQILASVGLAQNFAALRALVSEGIQKGHMSLHSRNIAIQAGAPPELVPEVSSYMIARGIISISTAQEYLAAHSILKTGTKQKFKKRKAPPSTMHVQFSVDEIKFNIIVVFLSLGETEVHLSVKEGTTPPPIQTTLFGEKDIHWFQNAFSSLESLGFTNKVAKRSNLVLVYKMKLLSMLMNLLVYRLIKIHPIETSQFIGNVLSAILNPLSIVKDNYPETIKVGFPLLYALWNVFKNHVESTVGLSGVKHTQSSQSNYHQLTEFDIAEAIKEEQLRIFYFAVKSIELKDAENLFEFLETYSRRWQITMFILCELKLVPLNLVNSEILHFLFKLGKYLEWEATVAHDVAKWKRDKENGETNSYLWWLKHSQISHSPENIKVFLDQIATKNKRRLAKLMQTPIDIIDMNTIQSRILPSIRKFYAVLELMQSKL